MNEQEIDNALQAMNNNLSLSSDGLKSFSKNLFAIAKRYSDSIDPAIKAAESLSRMDLSQEKVLSLTQDALILNRIIGGDSASAIDALTTAIDSFNNHHDSKSP